MKKFIFLWAAIPLFFCLNVQAADKNEKKDEKAIKWTEKDKMMHTAGMFLGTAVICYGVEQVGDMLELSESTRKMTELTTFLFALGQILENPAFTEAAKRTPLVLATMKAVDSKWGQEILSKLPILGEALNKMGDAEKKMLETVGLYVNIVTPVFEESEKRAKAWWNTPGQK